ncbi:hypothetical protein RND81_14G073400 [Saponaria officinalis]|uniref:L-gulonolactone oxidase n=1 Tax=Saponaria officinalis TaxID=3572 RepID=A0AAW1GIS7_SAPOF
MSSDECIWINTKRYNKISSILRATVIISSYLILWCQVVRCVPPEEPVKCSNGNSICVVTNGYGSFPDRSSCRAADVVYPVNEDQIISYVRDATKIKRKIKVATKYGHSFPKLVCPDGEDGLIISTKNLNKTLKIDPVQQTMTVQTGMTLEQFKDEAAKAGLALPHSPYWAGVTVGGMISTGSHGSSLRGLGSAVHDYVVGVTIISPGLVGDGFVKVRKVGVGDKDLQAVKVSLGVLGVISPVTFKLQPLFKRSLTYTTKDDIDLGDKVLTFGQQHEFGDITWLPSQREVIYRIDDRVTVSIPGNGAYDSTPLRSIPRFLLESVRAAGSKFTGYPVIGYQNDIQSSAGCLNDQNRLSYCGWDPRINGEFYYSNGFTVPLTKVKSFIQDIKQLVNKIPTSLCGVEMYNGILMRYVTASPAYLGKDEDGIDFDITYYRSRVPLGPRLFGDVTDEIEQMAVFKYNAIPHWGKNRNIAFIDVIKKYKDGRKFLKVKEMYDLLGLFSNKWTDQILGLNGDVIVKQVGCAREGLCVCADDVDCGPGYGCQGGRVYKMAKRQGLKLAPPIDGRSLNWRSSLSVSLFGGGRVSHFSWNFIPMQPKDTISGDTSCPKGKGIMVGEGDQPVVPFVWERGDESVEGENYALILVGRIWATRSINVRAAVETMIKLWNLKGKVVGNIIPAKEKIFVFRFEVERDKERVLEGQPWHFDKFAWCFNEPRTEEKLTDVPLHMIPLWARIYDLPVSGRSNLNNIRNIGEQLGSFICMEEMPIPEVERAVRIRILHDIRKPLRRSVEICMARTRIVSFDVKYERLPTYCYGCGILGHGEKDCDEGPYEESELGYGEQLRASPWKVVKTKVEPSNRAARVLNDAKKRSLFVGMMTLNAWWISYNK